MRFWGVKPKDERVEREKIKHADDTGHYVLPITPRGSTRTPFKPINFSNITFHSVVPNNMQYTNFRNINFFQSVRQLRKD